MSCAAACIRQLAKDNGINITEEVVRVLARTDGFGDGTQLHRIGPTMREIFIGKEIFDKTPFINGVSDYKEVAKIISEVTKKPWIATLKPPGKNHHTVIVDKIIDNKVYIRDPWGKNYGFGEEFGVEAIMKLEDFEYFWKGSKFDHARIK